MKEEFNINQEEEDDILEDFDVDSEEDKESFQFRGGTEPLALNKKTIIIIVSVVIGAILFLVLIAAIRNKKPSDKDASSKKGTTYEDGYVDYSKVTPVPSIVIGQGTDDPISTVKDVTEGEKDEIVPGMVDYKRNKNNTTSPYVYSADEYIKDLNGADIPAVYTVSKTSYENLFVNYEARRAVMDDGMELYWLEITYEDRPYRCQVPFSIYRALNQKGICVVQAEILTLSGGELIISYMCVDPDYLSLFK